MLEQRAGQKQHADPGPNWGVRMTAPAAAPLIVWSLYFDGVGDLVDCGNNASVMDLHAADFTCDVYCRTPTSGSWANFVQYHLVSQGMHNQGWRIYIATQALPSIQWRFAIVDGGGTVREAIRFTNPVLYETWYYLRARRQANNIHLSVDAGAEGTTAVAAGGTLSALNLSLGQRGDGAGKLVGSEVYVHLWNNNQGALGAVPNTPHALGANTAARYRFTDGAGAVLTDDSGNGNNGNIVGATWQQVAPAGWVP